MQQKAFLSTLFFFYFLRIAAQNIEVSYVQYPNFQPSEQEIEKLKERYPPHIVTTMLLRAEEKDTFLLRHQDTVSLFMPTNPQKEDPSTTIDNHTYTSNKLSYRTYRAYKNLAKGFFIERQESKLRGVSILKDELLKLRWTLVDTTREILGFTCKLAHTTHYLNDENTVYAWYTEEIPINNGPRLYGGLPGMILEIKENAQTTHAIKIRFPETMSNPKPPEIDTKVLDFENYLKFLDKSAAKQKRLMRAINGG